MASEERGVNLDQLVELYAKAQPSLGVTDATRLVAEALTSESTAAVSNAAEAISAIAAEAVQAAAKK